MLNLYTVTSAGTSTTRASRIFAHETRANKVCVEKNVKAEALGIKARYAVTPCDESWLVAPEKVFAT